MGGSVLMGLLFFKSHDRGGACHIPPPCPQLWETLLTWKGKKDPSQPPVTEHQGLYHYHYHNMM